MLQLVRKSCSLLFSGLLAALMLASPLAMALEVGDKAPDFALQGSDGSTYSLSQFQGEKPVVIAFFPKAFTGG